MKKTLLFATALCVAAGAFAFPKSLYVKKGDTYDRYNFGVAGNLNFSNGGKTLSITGYNEAINLDNIDYITFNAPIQDNALTPSAQKNKMLEIGETVNKRINMKENADVINMFRFLMTETDGTGDNYYEAPINFTIPEEYWNVHVKNIARSLSMIARLNPAGAAALEKAAVDLYKVEDYLGVYTADYAQRMWVKTGDASYLEMRFTPPTANGTTYVIRMTPSTDFTQWNTQYANVRVPRTMDIALFKGTTELGKLRLTTTLQQNALINIALEGKVGTAGVSSTNRIVNDAIDVKTIVTNKGEYITEFNLNMVGKNLVVNNGIIDDFKDAFHHHDEFDNCIEAEPTKLLAHIPRAKVSVDIMNLIQFEGRLSNPTRVYEIMDECFGDDDEDDDYNASIEKNSLKYKGYLIDTYGPASMLSSDRMTVESLDNDDPAVYRKAVNALNDYTDVKFHYDGTKTIQGFLGFDVDERSRNYENYDGWNKFAIINDVLVPVYDYDGEYTFVNNVWDDEYDGYYWENVPLSAIGMSEKDVIVPAVFHEINCEVMPLLIFPDMTSFAFADYFDEMTFENLIDGYYYDVVDTYYEITGLTRDYE